MIYDRLRIIMTPRFVYSILFSRIGVTSEEPQVVFIVFFNLALVDYLLCRPVSLVIYPVPCSILFVNTIYGIIINLVSV
jgi:hypothetical protein